MNGLFGFDHLLCVPRFGSRKGGRGLVVGQAAWLGRADVVSGKGSGAPHGSTDFEGHTDAAVRLTLARVPRKRRLTRPAQVASNPPEQDVGRGALPLPSAA